RDEFPRLLARAAHADRPVLPHRLRADVRRFGRHHGAGCCRIAAWLGYHRRLMRWLIPCLLMLAAPAHAFDLQGHRGARGLAPENTLAAFETALRAGVTTLELDLAMTADDVLVVSHDRRLNPDHTRGPDGKFLEREGPAIRSLTLAELQRYDVGRLKPGSAYAASLPEQHGMDDARIPALTELFDLVKR